MDVLKKEDAELVIQDLYRELRGLNDNRLSDCMAKDYFRGMLAGMVDRVLDERTPSREKKLERLIDQIEESLERTGKSLSELCSSHLDSEPNLEGGYKIELGSIQLRVIHPRDREGYARTVDINKGKKIMWCDSVREAERDSTESFVRGVEEEKTE